MTNPKSNLDLVTRMYACFNKGDLDTIRREIFAPNLVWTLPGHHPLVGTKNGAEEVLAFFAQLIKANIQVTLDPRPIPARASTHLAITPSSKCTADAVRSR